MSRDGAASGDTWLIGDAAHAVLYSTEVFGVASITLTPRSSATASLAMLGLIRRRSRGAARATMHWSLALSRLTGSVSLASPGRSEEHTSELQSRGHLVCRLLLEKKNPFGQRHDADCIRARVVRARSLAAAGPA